jgi:hypothetical protein
MSTAMFVFNVTPRPYCLTHGGRLRDFFNVVFSCVMVFASSFFSRKIESGCHFVFSAILASLVCFADSQSWRKSLLWRVLWKTVLVSRYDPSKKRDSLISKFFFIYFTTITSCVTCFLTISLGFCLRVCEFYVTMRRLFILLFIISPKYLQV